MKQKNTALPLNQCITAMGIVLNVAGAFIAMSLKLPIYMDSIGTMFVSALLGPWYGGLSGLLGGIASGFTFDVYSFYFAPAQMMTGIMAGFFFRGSLMKGKCLPLGVFLSTLPCTILSAVITAVLFGGLTSSGSSLLVMLLHHTGIPLTVSVFITQIATDFTDKFIAASLAIAAVSALSYETKIKLKRQ